jgi:hypothetical protein
MSPLPLSVMVFACVFGAALCGTLITARLPERHLSSETRDIVRLGMGLVSTTVAVVLGLLIASAKNFYDTQTAEVTQLAANVILLDRMLSYYGPEAAGARSALSEVLANLVASEDSEPGSNKIYTEIKAGTRLGEVVVNRIQALTPTNDNQRSLKSQAFSMALQLGQTRWLMFEQNKIPVPKLLLVMLIAWLIVLFLSFGIFAPRNLTVLVGLFVAAAAASGAILLILEMYNPQTGLIRLSEAPLRAAIQQLGR